METKQSEERPESESLECIEKLKNSPVINADYYYNLSRLCDAIKTLTFIAENEIERIGEEQSGIVRNMLGYLSQIDVIADVINEKVMSIDYEYV
jgi:hypothetical protein